MKFALVDNERQQAKQDISGKCISCDDTMAARGGQVRVHHWAHKGHIRCDPWRENETEWHRSWKNELPNHWQEVVHYADNGEKHIADIKTGNSGNLWEQVNRSTQIGENVYDC